MIDLFTPKSPEQPDAASYGVSALQLLPRISRSLYLAGVGEQANIWNKDRVIKRWADRTIKDRPPTGEYRYLSLVSDGTVVTVKENVISVGEALTLNLPGKYSWLKWIPPLVDGSVKSPYDGSITNINQDFVSTPEQADTIRQELGGTAVREASFGKFIVYYAPRERRRLFSIKLKGTLTTEGNWANVGLLLKMKYRDGMGAPGKWESPASAPRWIPKKSEAPDEYDLRPEVPIPIRALLPNEKARLGFAGIITIFKNEAGGGGQVGSDELLRKIDATTQQILTKVSAPIFSN